MRTALTIASRQIPRITRMSGSSMGMRMLRQSSATTISAALRSNAISARSFSVSSFRLGQGSNDETLAGTLKAEFEFEKNSEHDQEPEELKSLKEKWEIEEQTGLASLVLKREFGNEIIRVQFSIDRMEEPVDEEGFEQEEEHQHEHEENVKKEGEEGEEEDSLSSSLLDAHGTITVQKKNTVLRIPFMLREETFLVESMLVHKNDKIITAPSSEEDWKTSQRYFGPEFATLDEQLQVEIEDWLTERGIDTELAKSAQALLVWKEQREYQKWLKDLEDFVRA